MKNYLLCISVLMAYSLNTLAQLPYNPYKSIGKEANVLTLSNGKYDEFFDTDSLEVIGSAVLNTRTMKVIGFITQDTLYSEATLEPEIVSRWLSPDPLARKFPYESPYLFAGGNPILYIDIDGREIFVANDNQTAQNNFKSLISVSFDKKVEATISESGKVMFNLASGYTEKDLSTAQLGAYRQMNAYAVSTSRSIDINLENTAPTENKDIRDFGDSFKAKTLYVDDLSKVAEANTTGGLAMTYHFLAEQWQGRYPDVRSADYENSEANDQSCENCLYLYSHNSALKSSLKTLGIKFEDVSSSTDANNANLKFTNKEGKQMFNIKINLDQKKEFNVTSE